MLVTFVDDTGVSVNKLVTFATKPVGYGRERDSAFIYFTTTLERAVNGKTVQRIRIKKKGSAEETLIYELPQQTVASLQSDPLATGINYAVMAEFVVQLQGGTNSVVINTNKQNETFIKTCHRQRLQLLLCLLILVMFRVFLEDNFRLLKV